MEAAEEEAITEDECCENEVGEGNAEAPLQAFPKKQDAEAKAPTNMLQGQDHAPKEMQQSHEAEAPTKTSQPPAALLEVWQAPKEMPQSHEVESTNSVAEQTLQQAPKQQQRQHEVDQHRQLEVRDSFLVLYDGIDVVT